jgi:hypothetical protein
MKKDKWLVYKLKTVKNKLETKARNFPVEVLIFVFLLVGALVVKSDESICFLKKKLRFAVPCHACHCIKAKGAMRNYSSGEWWCFDCYYEGSVDNAYEEAESLCLEISEKSKNGSMLTEKSLIALECLSAIQAARNKYRIDRGLDTLKEHV